MPLISVEVMPHFENAIYFPLLITILGKDKETIENSPFKLKSPYLKLIDGALKIVHTEQKDSNIYMRRNNMKIIKAKSDGTFTEYGFYNVGYEDHRRYLNVQLRKRTEELMSVYFDIVGN